VLLWLFVHHTEGLLPSPHRTWPTAEGVAARCPSLKFGLADEEEKETRQAKVKKKEGTRLTIASALSPLALALFVSLFVRSLTTLSVSNSNWLLYFVCLLEDAAMAEWLNGWQRWEKKTGTSRTSWI
jgi:hypothetical protein